MHVYIEWVSIRFPLSGHFIIIKTKKKQRSAINKKYTWVFFPREDIGHDHAMYVVLFDIVSMFVEFESDQMNKRIDANKEKLSAEEKRT